MGGGSGQIESKMLNHTPKNFLPHGFDSIQPSVPLPETRLFMTQT